MIIHLTAAPRLGYRRPSRTPDLERPPKRREADTDGGLPMTDTRRYASRIARAFALAPLLCVALAGATAAFAADTVNVYSIWPENWARPMFEEFEKATGIKVNFVRFSSGEALARVIAEKGNPQVDVLFGGPVETFAAGINEGVFEAYRSPSFDKL